MTETYERHVGLLVRLGLLVVKWNRLEANAQLMLYGLGGGGETIEALTANMGTVALTDGLRTLGAEFAPEMAKEHITHYLDLFDRIRAYRNHYVHGVRIMELRDEKPVGLSQSVSAKSRLVFHQTTITEDDLQETINHINAANVYGTDITATIWMGGKPDKSLLAARGASFLQKPPLPDKLQKPRLFLLDEGPQRRSFPL
ncbi:hypothetical protein [Mesorhizobium sp. CA12]|uniref:hypothetical protein n=1 Tax=Mesorhizobium sp. CA12 TaxID=2876644 RepID=UPI001CCF2665|nr:hypothetical protein [Mesorhizobium sp. CA12]MBZ9861456.1 hypothetical protein [Mesorhizobium sp. CA12]